MRGQPLERATYCKTDVASWPSPVSEDGPQLRSNTGLEKRVSYLANTSQERVEMFTKIGIRNVARS